MKKNKKGRRGMPGPPGPMGPAAKPDEMTALLGGLARGFGEGIPKMFSHYGDIRREAWLTCMHAAAVWHATRGAIVSLEDVVNSADKLFVSAAERYPELKDPEPKDLPPVLDPERAK